MTGSVEVRFKNNGLEAIEVQDNGSGIAPEDYETIALKHHTSKLSTFDDLASIRTFGFRGEALSSLCALSKLHIITARPSDVPKGTRLDFEQSGQLKSTSVVAAKQGTTVVVETLFHNLPVRRKELEKTVKRQYSKVLELLHAYACISTGTKITVSNQMPKGKKTIAFSTNINSNTKENIANVFGAKALQKLIPLNLHFTMNPFNSSGITQNAQNWATQEDPEPRSVKIFGHISRPVVGEGRLLPDRQMLFVNSRPCNLPQITKVFNEVYKAYNITQCPFIFANIKLNTSAYDVNVSPDKRTIILHDQAELLGNLKNALIELFEGHDQSVPQAQLLGRQMPSTPSFKTPTLHQSQSIDAVPVARSASVLSEQFDISSAEKTAHPGFIKASLIERFAERDLQQRQAHPPIERKRSLSVEQNDVVDTIQPGIRRSEPLPHLPDIAVRRSQSPLYEPEDDTVVTQSQSKDLPKAVQDFNARITSHQVKHAERDTSARISSLGDTEPEERIPVIQQAPRRVFSQNTLQSAFDRMRPVRTPVQQATITIGDTTTVSTIGTGFESRASKRARVHIPKFSSQGTLLTQTPKRPIFMKSLRGFAAPGMQLDESEGENSDDEEDNVLEASGCSPSFHSRLPNQEFEAPMTDEIDVSSSVALPAQPPEDAHLDEDAKPENPVLIPDNDSDDDYLDEADMKAHEEAKVVQMIAAAEEATARPTEENLRRASKLFKISQKNYSTVNLEQTLRINRDDITGQLSSLNTAIREISQREAKNNVPSDAQLRDADPEERLSLTVTKSDFNDMRIIGQFNLGFILAVRPPTSTSPSAELFIIDQHASDEKFNFERLSATTVLVSQRLVHPHQLELTAVEEEVIHANKASLIANGFLVELDTSSDVRAGRRAKLTSLPMSKEVTFTPEDLEELLALILDNPPTSSLSTTPNIPRPSKIRKLLASRACRGSVMIGKTLKVSKMEEIVRHMGNMDKPWSCPHGRPTMRHLFGLENWCGWTEGDGIAGVEETRAKTNWAAYARKAREG